MIASMAVMFLLAIVLLAMAAVGYTAWLMRTTYSEPIVIQFEVVQRATNKHVFGPESYAACAVWVEHMQYSGQYKIINFNSFVPSPRVTAPKR